MFSSLVQSLVTFSRRGMAESGRGKVDYDFVQLPSDHQLKAGSGLGHLGSRLQTNARIDTPGSSSGEGGGVGEGWGGGVRAGGGDTTIGWAIFRVESNAGFNRTTAATVGEAERWSLVTMTVGEAERWSLVTMWGAAAARAAAACIIGVAVASFALIITAGRATDGGGGTRTAVGAAATTGFRTGVPLPGAGCATNSRRWVIEGSARS